MRGLRKIIVSGAAVVLIASCGDPGPLSVSIAPRQMQSGENRALTSGGEKTEYEPIQEVTYSIDNELPPVLESAMSFSFQPRSDNKLALRGMADALGVFGDLEKVNKNLVTIGYNSSTGVGLQLWVDASGGWWSYNSGLVSASSPVSCSSTDPDGCVSSAPNSAPPSPNVLTQAQAIRKVSSLLILSRAKPNNYVFSVVQTPWTTHVKGKLRLWAMTSNIEVNVLFDYNGKIISASGPMVAVKAAKTYPLITPEQGLERLKNPMFVAGAAVRSIATDVAIPEIASSTTFASRNVSISNVHLTLMQVLLSNGTYMLLPSFTYFDKNGEVGVVLAVQDKYLVEGEAPTTSVDQFVQPAPPSELPDTGTGTGDSGSSPGSPGVAPSPPSSEKRVVPLTDDNSIVLMGKTEIDVLRICQENGWTARVVQRDGTVYQVTQDYVSNRLNIRVNKGIVTAVTIG